MMRWLLILALTGMLLGCGGDDDDSDADADPGSSSAIATSESNASDATVTAEPEAADEGIDGNGGEGVSLTGGIEADITVAGACGEGVIGDDLQYAASGVDDGGNAYMLQIYVNSFEGPGNYDVTDPGSSYDASVSYSDGLGGSWVSNSESGGTVVVNADGQSGTVNATLENLASPDQTATIAGDWVCDQR